MNPYRISLDKSWGATLRVGQWVRYVGPGQLHGLIGRVVRVTPAKITISLRSSAGGLFDFATFLDSLERVERDDIAAEIAKRNEQ